MRTNSSTKKHCDYQKYVESRVLVSSSSIKPLSQHISTKLDLIKKQLSRQYHDKFETQKKPRMSSLKKSTSGSKLKKKINTRKQEDDLIREKLLGKKLHFDQQKIITPQNKQNRNVENIEVSYRDKYYQLQEKLLSEKQKNLQSHQNLNNFKQILYNFLEEQSVKNSDTLKPYIQQRFHKYIDRIFSLNEDVQFAQNTLNEIMMLLEVQDIQSLLTQLNDLVKRQGKFKGASEYTYKILELQTRCNKIQQEDQRNLNEFKQEQLKKQKQMEENYRRQMEQLRRKYEEEMLAEGKQIRKKLSSFILEGNDNNNEEENGNDDSEHYGNQDDHNYENRQLQQAYRQVTAVLQTKYTKHNKNRSERSDRLSNQFAQRSKTDRKDSREPSLFVTPTQQQQQQQYINTQQTKNRSQGIDEIINKIRQKFRIMQHRVSSIQKQAEDNVQLFYNSKNDIQRLERILQHIKMQTQIQKQKIIEEYTQMIQQKQQQITELQQKIKQKEIFWNKKSVQFGQFLDENTELQEQIANLKNQMKNVEKKLIQNKKNCQKRQNVLWKVVSRIKDIISKNQSTSSQHRKESTSNYNQFQANYYLQSSNQTQFQNKISTLSDNLEKSLKKTFQNLQQKVKMTQSINKWQQKQLSIKQSLLQQFDFNLKRMAQDSQHFEQRQKKLIFQRDQYKFLLSNLRQQITQLKKDYEQKLIKSIKEKDQEYLMSNRDILQINAELEKQMIKLKQQIKTKQLQLRQISAEHQFYKKKSEQQQTTLIQIRKNLMTTEADAARYKKCLQQIQASFKQVESMSQINSMKMIGLQSQNQTISSQISSLYTKNNQLIQQCSQKDEQLKNMSYNIQTKCKKIDNLLKNKQEIQYQNSQLRVAKLQVNQKFSKLNEQLNNMKYENNQLQKQNVKISQELTAITRKFIQKVGQKSPTKHNTISYANAKIQNQLKSLRTQYRTMKEDIADIIVMKNKQFIEMFNLYKKQNIRITQLIENKNQLVINKQKLLQTMKIQVNILRKKVIQKQQKQVKQKNNKQENKKGSNDSTNNKQNQKYKAETKQIIMKEMAKVKVASSSLNKQIVQFRKQVIKQLTTMKKQQQLIINQIIKITIKQKQQIIKQKQQIIKQIIKQNQQNKKKLKQQQNIKLNQQNKKNNTNLQKLLKLKQIIHSLRNQKGQIKLQFDKYVKQSIQYQKIGELFNRVCLQKQAQKQIQKQQQQLLSNKKYHSDDGNNSSNNNNQDLDKAQLDIKGNQISFEDIGNNENIENNKNIQNQHINQQQYFSPYFLKLRKAQVLSSCENVNSKIDTERQQQSNQNQLDHNNNNNINNNEIERVTLILNGIKNNQSEPKIQYFDKIKTIYQQLLKKVHIKNKILNLDISGVQYHPQTHMSSPTSAISFSKDFLADRRMNSQPNQQILGRQTNRSQQNLSQPVLKRQNDHLKAQIQKLEQYIQQIQNKQDEFKIQITQLQKKNTALQNQISQKTVQKLFLRFMDALINQKIQEMETNSRTLMKVMAINQQQIAKIMDYFAKKKKKKVTGLAGLFSK